MKEKIIKLYQFDELSDNAKERARGWWRESLCYDDWWESVYEDAAQAGLKITGFDLDRARAGIDRVVDKTQAAAEGARAVRQAGLDRGATLNNGQHFGPRQSARARQGGNLGVSHLAIPEGGRLSRFREGFDRPSP